jgi:hypothetical protein
MKVEMDRGVLLLPALTAALLLTACGGVNRSAYVARNEAIIKSLPVFPGAVKAHEYSTPNDRSEGGLSTRPSSYLTTVVYRVPRGTSSASVLRFYETQLQPRGWQTTFATPTVANLTRAGALVAVNTTLLMPTVRSRHVDWIYQLSVDQHGARN